MGKWTNGEVTEWGKSGSKSKERMTGGGIVPTTKLVLDLARIGVLTTMPQRLGAIWATTCPYVNKL